MIDTIPDLRQAQGYQGFWVAVASYSAQKVRARSQLVALLTS